RGCASQIDIAQQEAAERTPNRVPAVIPPGTSRRGRIECNIVESPRIRVAVELHGAEFGPKPIVVAPPVPVHFVVIDISVGGIEIVELASEVGEVPAVLVVSPIGVHARTESHQREVARATVDAQRLRPTSILGDRNAGIPEAVYR